MGADIKRENEAFQADYDRLYSKGSWSKDEIAMMKDLKKLIYYNLVICAMEKGESFPGQDHVTSGARGRDSMGRFTSGNRYLYPDYSVGDNMPWTTGDRYYDSEKKKAMHKLHSMMENTDDPERRNALEFALNALEQK